MGYFDDERERRLGSNNLEMRHYGAKMMTFGWLGTMRIPGAFVLFWMLIVVMRVAGAPESSTVNAPVIGRVAFMQVPEATPPMRPVVSPSETTTGCVRLWAGAATNRMFGQNGAVVGPIEVFGYGTGMGGAGGAGVRQTSGNAKFIPPIWVLANMSELLPTHSDGAHAPDRCNAWRAQLDRRARAST
jgi:hypothetical protein